MWLSRYVSGINEFLHKVLNQGFGLVWFGSVGILYFTALCIFYADTIVGGDFESSVILDFDRVTSPTSCMVMIRI